MNASAKSRRSRSLPLVQPLERRALMSGWADADSVAGTGLVHSMTADSFGNVYAAGSLNGAGLLREKAAGSGGFVTVATPATAGPLTVATAPGGDVFISDGTHIFERPAGQSTFTSVNVTVPSGVLWQLSYDQSFAANAAGDVYAVGSVRVPSTTTVRGKPTTTYTRYGAVFAMQAGQTSFGVAYQSTSFDPQAITLIDGGPSAGLYVINYAPGGGTEWNIRKSTNGGTSWSSVDSFEYDPNISGWSQANAIASDASGNGNIYVAGYGFQRVITGYTPTKIKGQIQQVPNYAYYEHWLTRRSSDGGATWSVVDDFQHSQTSGNEPWAIADVNGTVYVSGVNYGLTYYDNAVVRTNAGGTWQTSDYYASADYLAVTIDPVSGTPYAGGVSYGGAQDGWLVRSAPATTAAQSAFSSVSIIGMSSAGDRELVEDLLGATV